MDNNELSQNLINPNNHLKLTKEEYQMIIKKN